jgi:hypothetical protein
MPFIPAPAGVHSDFDGWGSVTPWLAGWPGRPSPIRPRSAGTDRWIIVLTTVVNVANFLCADHHVLAPDPPWLMFLRRLTALLRLLKPLWLGVGLHGFRDLHPGGAPSVALRLGRPYHSSNSMDIDSVATGPANLHRFGPNSAWFPFLSPMAQSVAPFTPNYTAIASETLLAVFGLAVSTHSIVSESRSALPTLFPLLSD